MGMESSPIQAREIIRQSDKPAQSNPPTQWINPDGGASGNNVEVYTFNPDTDAWELDNSRGPDTPLREDHGSQWVDTSADEEKWYDGQAGRWRSSVLVKRQTSEPTNPEDGTIWINPSGGASGNNTERYTWNADSNAWELTNAVGPDTPLYEVTGSLWRDTNNGGQKVYDGGWQSIGVTDHANLSGVGPDNHHPATASESGSVSVGNSSSTQEISVTFGNAYKEAAIQSAPTYDSGGVWLDNSEGHQLASFDTDADGNVTGVTWEHNNANHDQSTITWKVVGELP